jgi:hypothetical protein
MKHDRRWGEAGAVGLWLAAVCAWGGIVSPLYLGNLAPVLDECGVPMCGTIDSDPALRARVEIRTAADGVIRPPATDGAPHPANPLLAPDSVGGVGMNAIDPGLFAMVLPLRPAAGTKIFARVFNTPQVSNASFFADSAVVVAPASASSLVLTFGAAQPLDVGDADGDGLHNSWERALGIDDRATPDYDGDGMSDLNEMLASTAADDPDSLLAFRSVQREIAAGAAAADAATSLPVRVTFQAAPGKRYQLEHAPTVLGEQIFAPIGVPIVAGAGAYQVDTVVEVPADSSAGTFRIQLLINQGESP